MIKLASFSIWFAGLGFGLPCIYGIWSLWSGRGIARFMGFPTYGHGPFEKIGVQTTVPLLFGFFFLCVLQCIVGWGLWNSDKGSAILSMALIPLELAFYIGFALPFGPPFMLIRFLLLLFNWSSLN